MLKQELLLSENESLITRDGRLTFHPYFLDVDEADFYFEKLLQQIKWEQYEIQLFGKKIAQPRLTAWHGVHQAAYSYSGISLIPLPFTSELLSIKQKIESFTGYTFNSVLLNLYRNNQDSMGWHSDDEKELDQAAPIASVSFGGERKFAFKHKSDRTSVSLTLANGSVLLMHTPTQQFWQHSLTKTKRAVAPRINLTFRAIRHDHH